MNWLGWLWAGAIAVFFVGAAIVFSGGPTETENREHTGCAIAALGLLLMVGMLFVTIAVEPGY